MSLRPISITSIAMAMFGVFSMVVSADAVNANGDFETGDLTGWELFTTPDGTVGDAVVESFDIDGDGLDSMALKFHSGQTVMDGGDCDIDPVCRNATSELFQGGGIRQTFEVASPSARVTLSASVAAFHNWFSNHTGGKFELLVDDSVVDSVLIEDIVPGEVARAALSAELVLFAGTHEVTVQVSRPWGTGSKTPYQYIDDIVVDVTSLTMTKAEMLQQRGVPGNGIDHAPGLQKPYELEGSQISGGFAGANGKGAGKKR